MEINMKKIWLLFVAALLVPFNVFGACTETRRDLNSKGSIVEVEYLCIGSAVDGSVADVTITGFKGFHAYSMETWPLTPPPDAANVFLFDSTVGSTVKLDYLGSTDGTTAVNGLNLISATAPKSTKFVTTDGTTDYPLGSGDLIMTVTGQATVNAQWGMRIKFMRAQ
jgi:hypothetical protein